MNLRVVGCSYRTAPVGVREKLAFDPAAVEKAVAELAARYGAEAVILSTCNRVEVAVARPDGEQPWGADLAAEFLSETHGLPAATVRPLLVEHANAHAVRHLFRVAASLDSLVIGEGQIAGQVKAAYEQAKRLGATGTLLNTLFESALRVAKRVRTETGITKGHVSVSSVAVDYVRQVFDHFADKTVLVIGAGKMGRLTLKHLAALGMGRVTVTNRSPEKAAEVAADCGGVALPWADLDAAIAAADVVLSTTGARPTLVPLQRYRERVAPRRAGPQVVIDIAVPRDFDPGIHDGERVFVFNVDDLSAVRDTALKARRQHVPAAEAIVDAEVRTFADDWNRRRHGPVIRQLTAEVDKVRAGALAQLLPKLGGRLTDADRKLVEIAFLQFQNKLLNGPIAALREASRDDGQGGTLLESLKKLFRLE